MIEAERRERLQQRRALALRRLERQRESERFRAIAPILWKRGVKFSRVPPVALAVPLAPFNALPGRDERVYWAEVPGGSCAAWSDSKACATLLRDAFETVGADRVLLAFHPMEAALSIGAADLIASWPALHEELYDTLWIVPRHDGGWLVEISFIDKDLCWLSGAPVKA